MKPRRVKRGFASAFGFQKFDKTRHVCTLHVPAQVNRHREHANRVLYRAVCRLDAEWVPNSADADLVDSDVAYVGAALHVWDAVPESIRFRGKR